MYTRDVFGKFGAEIQLSYTDNRRSEIVRGTLELTKAGLNLSYEKDGEVVEWEGKQVGAGIGNFLLALKRQESSEDASAAEGYGSLHCFVGTRHETVLSYHDQRVFTGQWEMQAADGALAASGFWCVQRDSELLGVE